MGGRAVGSFGLVMMLTGLYAGSASGLEPKDIAGKYDTVSTLSDGKKYEGTVEITVEKGNTVHVTWTWVALKRKDIGTGRIEGDKLTVTYQRAKLDTEGKAAYTVQKGGTIVGSWEETNAKTGKKLSGTETMTPKK